MKRLILTVAAGMMSVSFAFAQDPLAVAPKNFKLLAENDKVRVFEFTARKGDKIPMHSHPAIACYVLAGGKTKYTMPDGKTAESSLKKGEVLLRDPVTHSHEHLTDAHAICTELKK